MPINRNAVLQQAEKNLRAGKVDAAIDELLKLVKDTPKDLATINRVGDLYARIGKNREAIVHYSKIADFYNQDGFLLKAIAIYKKITKLDPAYADAYQALARLYTQQGLTMEARAQWQIVADNVLRDGKPAGAIDAYQQMLHLDPDDLKTALTLAETLERLKRPKEALEAYRNLGESLDRRGMHRESRRVYEAALRLDSKDNPTVRRLVGTLRRIHASGEALPMLRGLLESRPGDSELLSLVGDAHLDHGDRAAAQVLYDQARKVAPERLENRLNQGRLALKDADVGAAFQHLAVAAGDALKTGRAEVVVDHVLELLDTEPHHTGALTLLADLHESAGQTGACRDACIRLAGASLEQGRLDQAAAALERLTRLEPENPRHQERLQDVLTRMKREGGGPQTVATPPAAAPAQVKAVAQTPTPLEPGEDLGAVDEVPPELEPEEPIDADFVAEHLTEAEVFVKYGLVDRAIEQLRQVILRYPAHVPAHEALAGIYREEGDRQRAAEEYRALARLCSAQGDRTAGEHWARLAVELNPEKPAHLDSAVAEPPAARTATAPPPSAPLPAPPDEAVEIEAIEFEEEGAGEAEIVIDATHLADGPPTGRLEEVDALIEAGALEEARRRLLKLRGDFPGRAEVEERLGRVELLEQRAQAAPAATPVDDSGFFDLAAELDDALFEPQAAVLEDKPEETDGHSLEDLVAAFKKGVEQQVSSEDYETHYNLAIAYKEMGLTDEAIGEFQFASKSPSFFLKCCSMLGICFREKGMNALAAKWYRKGLETAGTGTEEDALGLRYDLALLHEEGGEFAEALELLTEVYGVNAQYRDVADRIRLLGERSQLGEA